MYNPYDPHGEAAIWARAAEMVRRLKQKDDPDSLRCEQWNTALEQAARTIDIEGRMARQRNGRYYPDITGQGPWW